MSQTFNAKINVERGRYAKLTESGASDSYGAPKAMAGIQTMQVKPTMASASMYGDGVKLDEVSEFVSAALELTSAGESDETLAELGGHEYADGQTDFGASDSAPFVGYGAIAKTRSKGAAGLQEGYRAYFLPKVKFSETEDNLTAKNESMTYGGTTISATVFAPRMGKWKRTAFFSGVSAIASAEAWLDEQFDVPEMIEED